jgi:creatinine amidohydrolase
MSALQVRLHHLTWPEVREAVEQGAVVVIPTGSIEQHGPHLPLVVDALLSESIAEAAVEAAAGRVKALVAPAIHLGYSGEHLDFPGTLSLRPKTLMAVYADVIDSLAQAGFRRMFFLNGHAGNESVLRLALQEARQARRDLLATTSSYWRLAAEPLAALQKDAGAGIAHGGDIETSLAVFLAPDLVKMEQAVPNRPAWGSSYLKGGLACSPAVVYGRLRLDLTRLGHTGDPTLASTGLGERMFRAIVEAVTEFLVDFAQWPLPPGAGTPR